MSLQGIYGSRGLQGPLRGLSVLSSLNATRTAFPSSRFMLGIARVELGPVLPQWEGALGAGELFDKVNAWESLLGAP